MAVIKIIMFAMPNKHSFWANQYCHGILVCIDHRWLFYAHLTKQIAARNSPWLKVCKKYFLLLDRHPFFPLKLFKYILYHSIVVHVFISVTDFNCNISSWNSKTLKVPFMVQYHKKILSHDFLKVTEIMP